MILVINTSGAGLEFVLDDKYKHVNVEKQSIALPVEAENFLTECGAKWSDITAIGVVVGPGSFTGIRLGIAYAKGLALGLNIPIICAIRRTHLSQLIPVVGIFLLRQMDWRHAPCQLMMSK